LPSVREILKPTQRWKGRYGRRTTMVLTNLS
jgi:hypothetical protein